MKRAPGRPPLHEEGAMTSRIEVRVLESERKEFQKAAERAGFSSVNMWARAVMRRAIRTKR